MKYLGPERRFNWERYFWAKTSVVIFGWAITLLSAWLFWFKMKG